MRFLISNYSTPWNTEPFYFNASLSMIEQPCKLFNIQQSSIYDEFDSFNPEVFITHISHLSKDIMHYILNNKKIKLLVSTSNIDMSKLDEFSDSLKNSNIPVSFFGDQDIKLTNNPYIRVPQAADIFLNSGNKTYDIEKLIFVDKEEDIIELNGTYHYTSCNQSLVNSVDFILPINILNTLFQNYKEVVFKGNAYIGSQLSFNAIYSGAKVTFDTKISEDLDRIDSIFKGGKLLSSVKNRHTCLHRIKTLLSWLNNKDISDKLEREIERL